MGPEFSCLDCVIAGLQWIPVLIVLSITGWSYFAYVVQFCLITVDSDSEKTAYLVGYHVLLVTFLCFYFRTVFSWNDVPEEFQVSYEVANRMRSAGNDATMTDRILAEHASNLPLKTRAPGSLIRYCYFCELIKPDRAHHCRPCGICSLRLDHHCPWVNNCVAFYNYKFFVLFLGSLFWYCLFISLTTVYYIVDGTDIEFVLAPFCASVLFAVPVGILLCHHVNLVTDNMTTMEAYHAPIFRAKDDPGFSTGSRNNIREVFGDNCCLWFLPVFSSLGDGITFPPKFGDVEEGSW